VIRLGAPSTRRAPPSANCAADNASAPTARAEQNETVNLSCLSGRQTVSACQVATGDNICLQSTWGSYSPWMRVCK
jgi:hypothetical protein